MLQKLLISLSGVWQQGNTQSRSRSEDRVWSLSLMFVHFCGEKKTKNKTEECQLCHFLKSLLIDLLQLKADPNKTTVARQTEALREITTQ